MSGKQRLDAELVRRGLFPSRAQARAAIEGGHVRVGGVAETKPGRVVAEDAEIEAEAPHPWVSRGGVKLAHALKAFGVEVGGAVCLDVGASTGGFTDVLLAGGAAKVFAVDVGRGQLHPRLRDDPRVVSMEATDARALRADMLSQPPVVVVCDASFIGLAKVLPAALELAAPEAVLVALFKPQFEVGPGNVGKGGIVSDAEVIHRAAREVETWLSAVGWQVQSWTDSPIAGGDGNREQLLLARRKG